MKNISPLRYSLKIQLFVCLCLTLLATTQGKVAAYSLFLGASAFILPNVYFTHYASRYSGAEAAIWIKNSFIWGEMGKLSLAAMAFALVFRFVAPINVMFMFTGFISFIFLQWWLAYKIASASGALEDSNETRGQ